LPTFISSQNLKVQKLTKTKSTYAVSVINKPMQLQTELLGLPQTAEQKRCAW